MIEIKTGFGSRTMESSYGNGTLQNFGPIAVNIATDLLEGFAAATEEEIENRLRMVLAPMIAEGF